MASSSQQQQQEEEEDSKLDHILSQTLEEFSISDNGVNESVPNSSDQDRKDYTSSLEQVLNMLSQEEQTKGSEDYDQLLQSLVSQLSTLEGEKGGEEATTDGRQEETQSGSRDFVGQEQRNTEDDLENIMQVIVKQLLSREILQEPMEQLYLRYCSWLDENGSSSEDYERYVQQKQLVYQICEEYRGEGDTDTVLQLLQEMQSLGAPPPNVISQVEEDNESVDSQLRDLQNIQCRNQ
ncbi:Peroxisome biogenesis protein 19-1 [Galdieria sulphuraria]|uniref:Peroxin 19-1 n=1 Tax=Galdieria sulphuraria TaxID=130081 RepID=M2WSU1_GALSU|nr:peroxin 19-1 [Galdieria sulphuraria]EME26940.1 peroxin 19-1 [Galdieria sulphuraria]GJD10592.1 Peroxisome biogenesis protein 19-1 [Galdieria sulphuraria]|eukprot:XP_005703460.1 peroxin 19-1 [Galdieria sulphuraria]